MEFNLLGHHLNLSDDLIAEYLRRTDVYEDILESSIKIQLQCVLNNRDSYSPDLNKAVEEAIKEELEVWEER